MTEGNSATFRVELLLGDSKLLDAVCCLGSECLINFEDIDIINGKSASLEGSWDSKSRSDSHNLGRNTGSGKAYNAADNSASEASCDISASKKYAGGAISDLRRVTSGGTASLLESCLKFTKSLNSCGWSYTIIFVYSDLCFFSILVFYNCIIWSNLSLKKTSLNGSGSFSVALESKSILSETINTELGGHVLRCDSHWHEAVVCCFVFEDFITKKVGVDLIHHVSIAH